MVFVPLRGSIRFNTVSDNAWVIGNAFSSPCGGGGYKVQFGSEIYELINHHVFVPLRGSIRFNQEWLNVGMGLKGFRPLAGVYKVQYSEGEQTWSKCDMFSSPCGGL